jgi:hypothetical protein
LKSIAKFSVFENETGQRFLARIHYELAGYKPEKHAAADKDVEEIKAAIAALSAQVESN